MKGNRYFEFEQPCPETPFTRVLFFFSTRFFFYLSLHLHCLSSRAIFDEWRDKRDQGTNGKWRRESSLRVGTFQAMLTTWTERIIIGAQVVYLK